MEDRKVVFLVLITGLVAGVIGSFYIHLMHFVQHLVYAYSAADGLDFGQAVARVSTEHRLAALFGCGLVVGIGWVLIHRYGSPLVDIKTAVQDEKKTMPLVTTLVHATLQIITVGAGSPLGREVAPREASACIMSALVKHSNLTRDNRALIIACAAGAGLAAVYNAPLSAAVFILETLVMTCNVKSVGTALLSCGLAAGIVRFVVGDAVQYALPMPDVTGSYQTFAVILGIFTAVTVRLFNQTVTALPKFDRKSPNMIVIAVGAFVFIGLMAMYFPEILGNGKAGNELTFTDAIDWKYAAGLFLTKWLAVLAALAAGAYGGRITPSMMLGSTSALVLAALWGVCISPVSLSFAAFVGAVVFLGLAQKMPLTACIFMLEISRFSTELFYPMALAMGTALITQRFLQRKYE